MQALPQAIDFLLVHGTHRLHMIAENSLLHSSSWTSLSILSAMFAPMLLQHSYILIVGICG